MFSIATCKCEDKYVGIERGEGMGGGMRFSGSGFHNLIRHK